MKELKKTVFIITIVSLFAFTGFSLNVVATIQPYYLITSEIAGDNASVSLLVQSGANPHTFSPRVSQIKKLEEADLIIANGLGLEPYLTPYSEKTLYIGEQIPSIFLNSETLEHNEDSGVNPHVWLNPFFVKYFIVPAVLEELTRRDPGNRDKYVENARKLIYDLNKVIRRANLLFSNLAGSYVILSHPGYYYFFHEYSINVASIEEGHGQKPSISHLQELIKMVKTERVIGLFHEPQLDEKGIKTIAKETGRRYYTVDPLGVDVENITALFEKFLDTVEEALHE